MNFDFGVSSHKNLISIDVLPKYITPEELYLVFVLFILSFLYWLFKILFKIRYTYYLSRSLRNPIILDSSDLYCDRSTLESIAETHLMDLISCKSRSIVVIPSISIPFTYISEIKTENDMHRMEMYVNKEISIQFFYGVEFKNVTHYIDRNERVNVIKSVLKPLNGYTDEEILYKNTNNEINFPCLSQVPYSRTIHKDILNTYMYNNSTYGATLLPLICYVKEIKDSIEEKENHYEEVDKFDESFIIFDYKDNSNIQVLSYIILTTERVYIMKDIFDDAGDGESIVNNNSNKKSSSNATKYTSKTTNTSRGSRNQRRNRSRSHLFSSSQSSSYRNNNRISQREIGGMEVIPLGVVNEENSQSNNNNNNHSNSRMLINTRDVFNINVTDPLCNSHSTSPLLTNSLSVIDSNNDKVQSSENNNVTSRTTVGNINTTEITPPIIMTTTESKTETRTIVEPIVTKSEEKRSSKTEKDDDCIICLTNKVNTIFVGCRHKIICDECIKEVDKCPVCRSMNEAYLVI